MSSEETASSDQEINKSFVLPWRVITLHGCYLVSVQVDEPIDALHSILHTHTSTVRSLTGILAKMNSTIHLKILVTFRIPALQPPHPSFLI